MCFWRAGGTPETHLVRPFCGAGEAAVATKHFLSVRVSYCWLASYSEPLPQHGPRRR